MWNYRIIKFATKHNHEGDTHYYGLYETFYNDNGEIFAHDEIPSVVGDSPDDIITQLKNMHEDAEKYKGLVIDGDNITFGNCITLPENDEYQPFDPEDEDFLKGI